ncbi:LD-carboxypeptidase [Virgibacillus halophilus]|uniref:S66 peptidase family protein n=1 Tax=Tigheibacillus halophilus TaxID=361280 RepID=UPI0036260EDD
MILPENLRRGDTIGMIAPAGPPDLSKLQEGAEFFTRMGLNIQYGQHIQSMRGYLAGKDEQRLQDLHEMFADPQIKAIFCARGGYGTARIAADIDYELIRNNPKIFWGYSDITFLHTAIAQRTGLVTFHGPMPASDMADSNFDVRAARLFQQCFSPVLLHYNEDISPLFVIAGGCATAPIIGGNLSLIVSTLGTPFEIDTRGKLLLIEDVGEVPYKVDGMLNQLRLSGKIQQAAGVIIGDFSKADTGQPTLTLTEVYNDYFADFQGPVMSGFQIGHCSMNFPLPLGVNATLDTAEKSLTIEPGVCVC